jgi:cysteine desulfurase
VSAEVIRYLEVEFGNAGSRTHERGTRAKAAVQRARERVAALLAADPSEVVFTSGATEADNLALLGLAAFGERAGRRHIVSTQIEHKAVLEPLHSLAARGFEVDLVPPSSEGWVDADEVLGRVRGDTLLVSVMHANNETGVLQPIQEIAAGLSGHPAYLHVDAAQGFGKDVSTLQDRRIELISISAHKAYAPKGVGALVCRRRGFDRPPLEPLMFGGGQERGLRPGTLPVHLIVGQGLAAELARQEHEARNTRNAAFKAELLGHLAALSPVLNGDPERTLPHVVNLSIPGVDAEAAMVALKGIVEVSNGSACTSSSYEPSHVLTAMGLSDERIRGALRISWCHLTETPDWEAMVRALRTLRARG